MTLRRLAILIIACHVATLVVHSVAHSNLRIFMQTWQNIYITVVIILMPLIAGLFLWRRTNGGFLLLFISMLGALVFGGYYHFIAAGADNVSSLGHHSWSLPFQLSAVVLAVIETSGAITGLAGLRRNQENS